MCQVLNSLKLGRARSGVQSSCSIIVDELLCSGKRSYKGIIAVSDDPRKVWALASMNCTKRVIADLEVELNAMGKQLPTKATDS